MRSRLKKINGAFITESEWITGKVSSAFEPTYINTTADYNVDATRYEALYFKDSIARKIVDTIVEESLKLEPDFYIAPDVNKQLTADNLVQKSYVQAWNVIDLMKEAAIKSRIFGQAAILLHIADGKEYSEPAEYPLKPGQLLNCQVIAGTKFAVKSIYMDVAAGHKLGYPETFRITASDGTLTELYVHESRMILLRTGLMPQQLVPQFKDLSILYNVAALLGEFDQYQKVAAQLAKSATQPIFKVNDLPEVLANSKSELDQRIAIISAFGGPGSPIYIDGLNETYEQVEAKNMDKVMPLIDNMWDRIATAALMPMTKLKGMSPAGLNATGEFDQLSWYDNVYAFQKQVLSTAFSTLMSAILQSEDQMSEETVVVQFKSLTMPTEDQKLDTLAKKISIAKEMIALGQMSAETLAAFLKVE